MINQEIDDYNQNENSELVKLNGISLLLYLKYNRENSQLRESMNKKNNTVVTFDRVFISNPHKK